MDKGAGVPVAEAKTSKSIFSQLLERIVQGRGVKLGSGPEGEVSLEILLENCPDSLLSLSTAGVICDANPAFLSSFGYSRGELVGSSVLALIPEGYRPGFAEALARLDAEGPESRAPDDVLAFRGAKRDGTSVTMDCLLAPVEENGNRRVLAVIRDLSLDQELLDQLKESKDHYVALSETITEAIFRIDEDFRILFANSGVKNTFGYDKEELVGRNMIRLFPEEVFRKHEPEFRKYFYIDDQDRVGMGLKRTIELLGVTKYRGVAPMEISFGNSKEFRGRTLTCIVREISQRKTMERRLRHLAYHDKLTGLGNRDLFNEDMKAILAEPGWGAGRKAALLFMDLDGFKHINDTLGHAAGDELLVETARRIRFCLRDCDFAYRFGGDEFVTLLSLVSEAKDAALVADRILRSIREPYEIQSSSGEKLRVEVGVSIGAAVLPDHGKTAEAATKSADIAMYCSKEGGKNRYTLYDEAINTKSTRDWRLQQEMRQALVNGEFVLHYQPIVNRDGLILGLEALVRWQRDGVTVLPPSEFIPRAEENGIIVPLGAWALRRSLMDLRRLDAAGFHRMYISVNVSSRQLELPDFVDTLSDAVEGSGVDSSRVNLELTETTLLRNPDDAGAKILEVKRRYPSMMLAIDDFGTGYSSLSYLSRLPVDSLKIDISFVRALHREQNRKVVNAILNLAESLDINVVAEGIETAEQRAYFRDKRCKGMQGFLFMKGQPIDELEKRLRAMRDAASGPA
ncbi:MAG TPA: EAL domain-containing protein [Spirochaetales bacterium]|nr:EAL domain-containing protein [Spirochaetales bacterium]